MHRLTRRLHQAVHRTWRGARWLLLLPGGVAAQDSTRVLGPAPLLRSTLLVGLGVARGGLGVEYVHRPTERWGVGLGVGGRGLSGRLIATPVVARTRAGQGWWPYVSAGGLVNPGGRSLERERYGADAGLQYRGRRKQAELGLGSYRYGGVWATQVSVAFGWGWAARAR